MDTKKSKKKPMAEVDSPASGSSVVFIGWIALLVLDVIYSSEKGASSYRRGHGGLMGANTLVFILLFFRRRELPNMLRVTRRVLRWPLSSTWRDYESLCMIACAAGAIITTLFVVDPSTFKPVASLLGFWLLLIGPPVVFYRWRVRRRVMREAMREFKRQTK